MDQNPFDAFDAEAARIDRFYTELAPADWQAPTRCAGWNRKDVLAHLGTVEDYTRACLDDRVGEFAGQGGSDIGYERLNDVLVGQRAGTDPQQLLAEWRLKVKEVHPRLRERGRDGTMTTSVGPYPVARQTWYLASELAIHADDAGVPVGEQEYRERLRWRVTFAIDALAESAKQVQVESGGGDHYALRLAGAAATLTAEELVEAAAGRLPAERLPAELRRAVVVLA